MYNSENVPGPEFRVRTVPRFIVTRYCHPYESAKDVHGDSVTYPGSSILVGEFQNEQQAFDVAHALAQAEAAFGATVST